MVWVCIVCGIDLETVNGGVIPHENGIAMICESCINKYEPRGRHKQ